MTTRKPQPQLYLSDARGAYIPRDFARETKRDCIANVSPDTFAALESGPDSEFYWDAWTIAESNAIVTDPMSGVQYRLHHDGDLWLIPVGMEWADASGFFAWPGSEGADNE